MNWRLGLDLGETSIGWCAFQLHSETGEPQAVIDSGVRIFPSGREAKSNEPLAVARRLARQKRRQLDRKGRRLKDALKALEESGLLPTALEERNQVFALDPYHCRALAVQGKATNHQLGRALAHLAKRRGFRSSRKDLSDEAATGGSLREGMSALAEELRRAGGTLGQLLWSWQQDPKMKVRFRRGSTFYPERWMYQEEFRAIREANSGALASELWERVGQTIFLQRPLKPVERGKCCVRTDLERAPKCLPSFEVYRLWENINNLRWFDTQNTMHELSTPQRKEIFRAMVKVKGKAFSALGKKLPDFAFFNLASEIRPTLEGCPVHYHFTKAKFPGWEKLSLEQKDDIVNLLLDIDDDARTRPQLEKLGLELDLNEDVRGRLRQLGECWQVDEDVLHGLFKKVDSLSGVANFCPELLREIIPIMAEKGVGHRSAICDELGYSLPSDLLDGSWDRLPYYGEILRQAVLFAQPEADPNTEPEKHFGRLGNPTVHRALNQVRLIVNALMDEYGKPDQVVVELARDLKLSRQAKLEILKAQRDHKSLNDRARTILQEQNLPITYTNLLKVKLWEELGEKSVERRCVFSGKLISLGLLFANDSPVEIEHILPFSRTFDDSPANKTLCFKEVNTLKGNRSPYEAFGQDQASDRGIYWSELAQRAQNLPFNKRRRFTENAMEAFEDDKWISRQLNDTAYLSRQTTKYLNAICKKVWSVSGRLTQLLRRHWRLNHLLGDDGEKNRADHRHHAIDAFVVGLTSVSLIQHVAKASRNDQVIAGDLLDKRNPTLPVGELKDEFAHILQRMLVSFKPDHSVNQRFFAETAYGLVHEEPKQPFNIVTRATVESIESGKQSRIRDSHLRDIYETAGGGGQGVKALQQLGIKRVRMLKTNSSVQKIPSAPYKAYALDGYAWCDIWRLPGAEDKVVPVFVTYLDALRIERDQLSPDQLKPHPAAKRLMRLRKDDLVRFQVDGSSKAMRVVKYHTPSGSIVFVPANSSNLKELHVKRTAQGLLKLGLQKLHVTPLGKEGRHAPDCGDRKPGGGAP